MPTTDDKNRQDGPIRASYLNLIVARNVARLRHERELSQGEVAHRAGVSRLTIVGIESGRRIVGINELPGLCIALDCNLTDLMEGRADEPADRTETPLGYARSIMLPRILREPIESALRRLIRDELLRP